MSRNYTEHPDDRAQYAELRLWAAGRGWVCVDPTNDYGYYAFSCTRLYPEYCQPFIVLAHGAFWVCDGKFRAANEARVQDTALSGPFDNIDLAAVALQLEE